MSQAKKASRLASAGFGCAILITSASDGSWPTLARSSTWSEAWFSQSCTRALGRLPRDFRPIAPERMICTKVRSILPLSMTRLKTAGKCSGPCIDRIAVKRAGMSFMWPRRRA